MNFKPKTEEEIALDGLLPKGEYAFEVIKAEEKQSKQGNPMIELLLQVFPINPDGKPCMLKDWILEAFAIKLRHFCAVTGQMDKYAAGTLGAQDCIGKTGVCMVGVTQDKEKKYPPKNSIVDYVPKATQASPTVQSSPEELEDQDVPW